MTTDDEKRAIRCDRLWDELIAMSVSERLSVLNYLCGYCKSSKKFVEGLEAGIRYEKNREVSR